MLVSVWERLTHLTMLAGNQYIFHQYSVRPRICLASRERDTIYKDIATCFGIQKNMQKNMPACLIFPAARPQRHELSFQDAEQTSGNNSKNPVSSKGPLSTASCYTSESQSSLLQWCEHAHGRWVVLDLPPSSLYLALLPWCLSPLEPGGSHLTLEE